MAKSSKTMLTPEDFQEEVRKVMEAAKPQTQTKDTVAQATVVPDENEQAPATANEQVTSVTSPEPAVNTTEQANDTVATPVEDTVVEGPAQSDAPVISQQEMQELRQSPLWQKATMANKQALVAMLYESNKPGALDQMSAEIKDKLISANVELIDAFNEVEEAQKKEEELFQYAQSLIEKYGEELKQSSSSSSSSYRSRCGSSSSNTEWYEIAGGVAAGILGGVGLYYGAKALYEWGVGSLVDSELDSFDSLSFS